MPSENDGILYNQREFQQTEDVEETMRIAIVGATGFVGSRLVTEAISRGHLVTAITRDVQKIELRTAITAVEADVMSIDALKLAFAGIDAVIHAYAPPKIDSEARIAMQSAATRAIITAMKDVGVVRLLAVGGAGTLEVAPGIRFMDTYLFPKIWLGGARSTAVIKEIIQSEQGLLWTSLSPAHLLEPGERTGKFRIARDNIIADEMGRSAISVEDYAVAMINELENPEHTGHRFTVGY